MSVDKLKLRALFDESKQESLVKNKKIIDQFIDEYNEDQKKTADLVNGKITVLPCETTKEKRRWAAYVHLEHSMPYRGGVGRRVQFLVYCDDVVIGMFQLMSPMAQCRVRDQNMEWTDKETKWKNVNRCYNISICCPVRKYANVLTGKLLVFTIFSKEVVDYMAKKYDHEVLGFETTSLYGKSAMYNRIPFLKFLGLTDGYSAICITDGEWKKIRDEWRERLPNNKQAGKDTSRLAEVKYQVIHKLKGWYKKNKIDFPYNYEDVSYRRGVYFGFTPDCPSLDSRIAEWRKRWLTGRLERGYGNQV